VIPWLAETFRKLCKQYVKGDVLLTWLRRWRILPDWGNALLRFDLGQSIAPLPFSDPLPARPLSE
jgi:hypothetical protein